MNEQDAVRARARRITALKKQIVARAMKFANLIPRDKEGKRQLRNLLAVASTTDCVDELRLYILYKAHKDGSRRFWEHCYQSKESQSLYMSLAKGKENVSLAQALSEQIRQLKNLANHVEEDSEEAYIEVVRLFLGYLFWSASVILDEQRGKGNHVS
jgi:hypothetical protein